MLVCLDWLVWYYCSWLVVLLVLYLVRGGGCGG